MGQFDKSKQSYLKTGLKFDDIKAKWLTCWQNQTSWGEKLFHMMKWLRCNLCKQEVVFLHCRKCSRQSSPSAVFFTAPRFLPCSIIAADFPRFLYFATWSSILSVLCILHISTYFVGFITKVVVLGGIQPPDRTCFSLRKSLSSWWPFAVRLPPTICPVSSPWQRQRTFDLWN